MTFVYFISFCSPVFLCKCCIPRLSPLLWGRNLRDVELNACVITVPLALSLTASPLNQSYSRIFGKITKKENTSQTRFRTESPITGRLSPENWSHLVKWARRVSRPSCWQSQITTTWFVSFPHGDHQNGGFQDALYPHTSTCTEQRFPTSGSGPQGCHTKFWARGTRIHCGPPMNVLHRGRGFNPFRLGTHYLVL
jgi:hypothetical protein